MIISIYPTPGRSGWWNRFEVDDGWNCLMSINSSKLQLELYLANRNDQSDQDEA